MRLNYLIFFEIAIGIYTAIKAKQKKQNPFLWLLLGTAFSLIALAIILEMPTPHESFEIIEFKKSV